MRVIGLVIFFCILLLSRLGPAQESRPPARAKVVPAPAKIHAPSKKPLAKSAQKTGPTSVGSTAEAGVRPTTTAGRVLNLDFETGTSADWTAEGQAFQGQPIVGDTVHPRRADMKSQHQGKFWIGTYEHHGDTLTGTLTSASFVVTHPFASFLVAGGSHESTCVEVVRKDNGQIILRATGHESENLERVVVNLQPLLGKEIFLRVVDRHQGHWGHVNFDDFRFHATMPNFITRVPQVVDVFAHAGLAPEAAAKAMTVPEGFSVTLFAGEPDVRQPIAMAFDDRGRLWIAEAYSYPLRLPDDKANDRVLIFEDRDGDGKFDSRKVFADKLNLVSGLELGFGGVWVGAAPYLLFIPDRDGDDKPDGPAEKLLDGWGWQDTHETLNSFIWGPDGWLYGCHGVFTHSRVGKPGTPDDQRVPINAGIWRYHPTRHRFEVFAQGTSNPWGVDFNDHGQAFLTACVIPHLYHVVQGGRYIRQAGLHFNPYTYRSINTIAKHRHYIGDSPHRGNNKSDAAGGGHAHAGAMIYLGGSWPPQYRNQIFMNNIHGARLNVDQLIPQGSGYVGDRSPDFLLANDRWSQILYLTYGPDGQVYMIDWYDNNQCHHGNTGGHDRSNGRIFKIQYRDARPARVDLRQMSDRQLFELLASPNDWYVRHARRLLQERAWQGAITDVDLLADLENMARRAPTDALRLRALWALHALGGLAQHLTAKDFADPSPYVRGWLVQLWLENQPPTPALMQAMKVLARTDPSPIVRLYLASGLQRIAPRQRFGILEGLLSHVEDVNDHNLPLMYWYAAEPLASVDASRALEVAARGRLPLVQSYMARRVASESTPEALEMVVEQLSRIEEPAARLRWLEAVNLALAGHRKVTPPSNWSKIFGSLAPKSRGAEQAAFTALAIRFGDSDALAIQRKMLADPKVRLENRKEALSTLLSSKDEKLPPELLRLLQDPELRALALRGLAAYDEPRAPEVILALYPQLNAQEKRDALTTLAARGSYAQFLLTAIADNKIPTVDVSADVVRQLRNLGDKKLDETLNKVWGTVRDTPEEKRKLIASYQAMLTATPERAPDVALGRALFAKNCQQCHILFGLGRKVGPDLTGSNRANLEYLLSNVLDPSALIGKDYQAHVVALDDGRVVTGIISSQDKNSLSLLTNNETLVLPRAEIVATKVSDKSMMPDDLLKALDAHQVRSLVAYLASPVQTPVLAQTDNLASFFNGRDLTGWTGNSSLWSVENGEIVGRSPGLKRNEFLRSDLLAENFRLTVEVLLVKNQGNSGIQFRSEALPEGEIKGYQADIGIGWWGKLYEEHGRGLVWKESGEKFIKHDEWNRYEIIAKDSSVTTFLNGQKCAELEDDDGARRGIFALQLHSGGPTEVRFRNLKLELLP